MRCRQERKMKRVLGIAAAAVILLASSTWGQTGVGESYHGPGVGHATDIIYPANTQTMGIVTLDVSVDATGAVQNVSNVRDVPPLTIVARLPTLA